MDDWLRSEDQEIPSKWQGKIYLLLAERLLRKKAVTGSHVEIRERAVIALPQVQTSGTTRFIVDLLKDKQEPPRIRACAAITLPDIGSKEASPPLYEALKDEEPLVAQAAAKALQQLPSRDALLALTESLKRHDTNHYVLEKMLESIDEMSSQLKYVTEVIDPLRDLLMRSEEALIVPKTVEIVERIGGSKAREALDSVIESSRFSKDDSSEKYQKMFKLITDASARLLQKELTCMT